MDPTEACIAVCTAPPNAPFFVMIWMTPAAASVP